MNRKPSDDTALLASIRAAVALGTHPIAPDSGEQLPDEGNGQRATNARSAPHIAPLTLPHLELVPPFRVKSHGYTVDDFLVFNDRAFIDAAYRGLVKRQPDTAGAEPYLLRLRRGASKLEILGRIRYSPEGRRAGVPVKGLSLRAAYAIAGSIPLLGYVLRWAMALVRLPRLVEHHRALEYRALAQIEAVAAHENNVAALVSAHMAALVDRTGELGNDLAALEARHVHMRDELKTRDERTAGELTLISTRLDDHETASDRLAERLESHFSQLASSLASIEDSIAQAAQARERKARRLDPFYAAFEQRFRGERQEIKDRVGFYLNIVRSTGIGGPASPVLDVGCGRGEWLEVLKDSGLHGRGIDMNRTSVAYCRGLGLDVTEEDAVACLSSTADGSLGAVVGLHIIEHLPFDDLLELIDQAHRALMQGGALMFETPNPGNVLVGTNNFHTDPTHVHPLPAELMKFTLEARGFSRVEVTPLHAYPAELRLTGGELADRFNDYFYGAQDYAVIGWK